MTAMDTKGQEIVGVIGGSGIDQLEGLGDVRHEAVVTPFGSPSDELVLARLDHQDLVFLPRHGRGHKIPPSQINFRANIYALKMMGCTQIISLSAVGSLKDELSPGTFVMVDQFIDRTFDRAKSFFDLGLVGHVALGEPVCERLRGRLLSAAQAGGIEAIDGGTYLAMEGPQFSTRAESNLYRSWGCDVIGMTNMPEAKLAREAEICYATVAMVTDYDCWHPDHDDVTVETILQVLTSNSAKASSLLSHAVPTVSGDYFPCPHGCRTALDNSLVTSPDHRDEHLLSKLGLLLNWRKSNVG
jgi:5'-methylthioadenosine phosphorylase